MTAYKSGLKGITVYREGSREGILITNDAKDEKVRKAIKYIPRRYRQNSSIKTESDKRCDTKNPNGRGTLYITINEDENGLCEVFTTIEEKLVGMQQLSQKLLAV